MDQKIYTVRELSHALRNTLESRFRAIRVEGELSGISAPSSGHLYFSLKEGNALIRCAWFRNRQKRGAIVPEEGMQVIADGQISVYESRGDLQLIVTDMQVSGEGALKLAFERLKRKLQAEGLFEPDTKRPLPAFPKTVGLLTSPGGAVLHDMLVTMNRRFPMVRVILYPVPVQGDSAPPEIARMLDIASRRNEVDVIVVARGGGSAEDLQMFNDEEVARAIFRCGIPVISAVGHEIDFSISDFVADHRAPTPTAAAELVTADGSRVRERIRHLSVRLEDLVQRASQQRQQTLDYLSARLARPDHRLRLQQQSRIHLTHRLSARIQRDIESRRIRLNTAISSLRIHSPSSRVDLLRQRADHCRTALDRAMSGHLAERAGQVERLHRAIEILGPSTTLNRGYAIAFDKDGAVIMSPSDVESGDPLDIRVAKGQIAATAK